MMIINNRGVALVVSFSVIMVLSVISAAYIARVVSEKDGARRNSYSTRSFWLAEAGMQGAIYDINNNSCQSFVQCGTATACTDCTCSGADRCWSGSLANGGDYDITWTASDNYLTSLGSYPSRVDDNRVERPVRIYVDAPGYALFAQGEIEVAGSNNTVIDSYNSSDGAYGGDNVSSNGDIRTNSTDDEAIEIGNNTTVNGSVNTGPGGSVDLGNNTTISGATTDDNVIDVPSVTVPVGLTGLASGGAYSVARNGSSTINAGSYKYSSISLNNGSTLNINGDVSIYLTSGTSIATGNNTSITIASGSSLTLYVDGTVEIDNNSRINNTTQTPANFVLYSTYSGDDGIELNNNGAFYGVIYAPDAGIEINNNADTYGAIIGSEIEVSNNANIHYDEAVGSLLPFEPTYSTYDWQEPLFTQSG